MKRDTDWTDALGNALRDAEVAPAEEGWERLRRRLEESEPRSAEAPVAQPRETVRRIRGLRIAAAAAVVLFGIVAGELLWRPDRELGDEAAVAVSMTAPRGDAADRSAGPQVRAPQPGTSPAGETLRESLARASGWTKSPSGTADTPATWLARVPDADAESGKTGVPLREKATLRTENDSRAASAVGAADETPRSVRGPGTAAAETVAGKSPESRSEGEPEPESRAGTSREERPGTVSAPENTLPNRSGVRRNARPAAAYDDPFRGESRKTAKTSLALFAGGGMTGSSSMSGAVMRNYSLLESDVVSLVGNGNNFSPMKRRDYRESSFRHHLPLSFGFTVRKGFPHALSLESGVIYTLLRSDVRLRYSSEDVGQKLHFIGIPLRLNWQFVERGRFSAYVGAGGMVEKCVSAKFGSESVDEGALQWSALAAIGAQYRLADLVGLYFEPEASYYFTGTELCTSRTEAPLTLTLRLGVRILF